MKRRKFLHFSLAGSLTPLLGFSNCAPEKNTEKMNLDFDLLEMSIADLQSNMSNGGFSSKEITQLYLERIKEIDKEGHKLNAVIEINPDALEIAELMDQERKAGKMRGPLHGIPIMIKDNIDTGDKMKTTAGSLALLDAPTPEDAFIVKKIREAGAVLLGKTNLSEWANFRSIRSSSGWSGRGKQTKNPYVLTCNPCGSSSGSGVAVSANLCTIAIGTETDGSIMCPASSNGVVGLKPTVGLWSRNGIIPISETQDTAGPMARCVADAAALLGALTGVDPNDAKTSKSEGRHYTDYTRFLTKEGLDNKRIGVLRSTFGFHEKVDDLMEEAMEAIKTQGAKIVDPIEIATFNSFNQEEFDVMLFEFKDGLNRYLQNRKAQVSSLEALIEYNQQHKDKVMPFFGQELLEMAQEKGSLDEESYKKALELMLRKARAEGIDACMEKYQLDAIIAPTGGPAWTTDLVNGDHYGGGSSTMAAVSGYPSITVPAGFITELPVGITFFSTAWKEPELIGMAYAFEQATMHRKAPRFLNNIGG